MRLRSPHMAWVVFCVVGLALIVPAGDPLRAQDFPDAFIDLSDMVAGGDGRGTGGGFNGAREFTGIDADTGQFLDFPAAAESWNSLGSDSDGVNPAPVEASDFVDSVFFMTDVISPINTEGVEFEWLDNVQNQSWGHIYSNFTHSWGENLGDIDNRGEGGNVDIVVGEYDFPRVIGVHADLGITFDLDEIRSEYGNEAVNTFVTFAGVADDALQCGLVHLYVIYSNEEGIVESNVITNVCPFRQEDPGLLESCEVFGGLVHRSQIPVEAAFLTLATTRVEGFGCDFGAFANAWIVPETQIEECVTLELSTTALDMRILDEVELRISCRDNLGYPTDVTSEAVYNSSDENVVTIDANGSVTAVGGGEAEITVSRGDLEEKIQVSVADAIDLGDIVAGGDGNGSGGGAGGDRDFSGINPDNGELISAADLEFACIDFNDDNNVNPSPVLGSDFVDAVFLVDTTSVAINSEGVVFDWPANDVAPSYGPILSNRTHRFCERGTDEINAGGSVIWSSCVGVHASAGITFDLEEIRAAQGANAVHTFSTFAGATVADCGGTRLTPYIIYSNEDGIVSDPSVAGSAFFRGVGADGEAVPTSGGERYLGVIPEDAAFLTLAVGAADGNICRAQGVFANPRILVEGTAPDYCESLEIASGQLLGGEVLVVLEPNTRSQLRVNCIDADGFRRNVSAAVHGTTYSADPPGIVEVRQDGLLSAGLNTGDTLVTATRGALSATVKVIVATVDCENLKISPADFVMSAFGTATRQLQVTCDDRLGFERDVTSGEGVSYGATPEGVVTVDTSGLVTAVREGTAEITASLGDLEVKATVSVARFLDLADVVAGGDGSGSGGGDQGERGFTAIDVDNGSFLREDQLTASLTFDEDLINPTPVPDSDLIDQVFILTEATLPINSSGGTFQFEENDPLEHSFSDILSNFTHNIFEVDKPERFSRVVDTGGRNDWSSGIGIHSSAGITFDLDALRALHGPDVAQVFSTFAGHTNNCDNTEFGSAGVRAYVVFSDASGMVGEPFTVVANSDEGERYVTDIPADASYLTLAVGAFDPDPETSWFCDGGVFAEPRILPPVPVGPIFKRGDVDGDGSLSIGDPIGSLSFQFLGSFQPPCLKSADFNDDGTIDIGDPINNLSHQFLGTAPPAEPGKETCGLDPTEDEISCEGYPEDRC